MNATTSSNTPFREISVVEPVNQALDRMMNMLFRPFDLGKWFVIGFTAWLALLGEGGGANFNFHTGGGNRGGKSLQHQITQAKDYVLSNLGWIIPVVAGVVVVCVALWLLITWLSSRGKFMFLHCVAHDRAEVSVPWRHFAAQGNSLFWFRIVLGCIGLVIMLPLLIFGLVIGAGMIEQASWETAGVIWLILIVLGLVGFGLVFWLIAKLTTDFVVPFMFVSRCRCLEGWRTLCRLLGVNWGKILLYLLFQIVLGMITGTLVLFVAILTCCVCCLLLVPYLGTVILLPVLIFHRAYSAYYIAQYGPDFDVFRTPAPTA